MPVLGGARGLVDLPGFDRIAVVSYDFDEPVTLRGSSARRLAQHLIEGKDVDHLLPALCSPPPSDLDLLFQTDQSERIAAMVDHIRYSAPLFQALRVETSSLPRLESLESELEALIDCPALGVYLAAFDEEGFEDRTGRGLQQLSERRLTFHLDSDAYSNPDQLDPDQRFHLYCACLVFAKAAYEHGSREDFLDSEAMEFCRRNVAFAREMATPPESRANEGTAYYRARLYGLAYSLRAVVPNRDFTEHVVRLLPARIGRLVRGSRPRAPLFNVAKSLLFEPAEDWSDAAADQIEGFVDLAFADPLASSPPIPIQRAALTPNSFIEGLIPLSGNIAVLKVEAAGSVSAAIKLGVKAGGGSETVWLPSFCEGFRRQDTLAVRVSIESVVDVLTEIDGIFGDFEASLEMHLLGHRAEERGIDTAQSAPIHPDDDVDEFEEIYREFEREDEQAGGAEW